MGVLGVGVYFSMHVSTKLNITCNYMPSLKIGGSGGRGRGTNLSATTTSTNTDNNTHMELNAEQLKAQLETLQREAEEARGKANSTRARFMRLSDAVDKLQLQALANIKAGKESSAREVLLQKRKVMQALEKSKRRAELLDELLTKLGEAISAKEFQLIEILASNRLGNDIGKDNEGPVRVVSSAEDTSVITGKLKENLSLDQDSNKTNMDEKKMSTDLSGSAQILNQLNQEEDSEELLESGFGGRDNHFLAVLKGTDSYHGFLIDLDQQIAEIELKLHVLLKFSSLLLEDEAERLSNQKVKTAMEILETLQSARARIAGVIGKGKTSM